MGDITKEERKMDLLIKKISGLRKIVGAGASVVAVLLVLAPDMAHAQRGGDGGRRLEFYGIVQARPENVLPGKWLIGGRTFIADAGTEFDQVEGKLAVGGCAKVQVRNGRVHEIDSEPMRNCQ